MAKSGATRRKQATDETHRLISKTAIALFNKKGYGHVTVDEICDKAGVAKGTFYRHFKSKDYIIIEGFLDAYTAYMGLFEEAKEIADYRDRTAQLLIGTLEYFNSVGVDFMKVVFQSQLERGQEESPISVGERELYKVGRQLVLEAQENGEARADMDAEKIIFAIVRSVRGIVYEWCMEDGGFDLVEAGKDLMSIIAEGLVPR